MYWHTNDPDQLALLNAYVPNVLSRLILQYGSIPISSNNYDVTEYGTTDATKDGVRFWFAQALRPEWIGRDSSGGRPTSFLSITSYELPFKTLYVFVDCEDNWQSASVYIYEYTGKGYRSSAKVAPSPDLSSMRVSFDLSWFEIVSPIKN